MLKIQRNSNRKLKSKQIIHIYVKGAIFLTWVFEGFGGNGASHGDRAQSGPGVLKPKIIIFYPSYQLSFIKCLLSPP